MRANPFRIAFVVAAVASLALTTGCGQSSPDYPDLSFPNTAAQYLPSQGPNVVRVQVGGLSICGQHGYLNEPCTSVTVCEPGTQNCQTISDILVDSGSTGFRVFSSALTLNLVQQPAAGGSTLAECAQFGSGSDWGAVVTAGIVLGGEPEVDVPIQVIDKSYATAPLACAQADTSPTQVGFNGILGIGPFAQDCGAGCSRDSKAGIYYSCGSSGCQPTSASSDQQVGNPMALLPDDNNGVLLALPAPSSGSLSGVLVFGVGTGTNNAATGATAYPLDTAGNLVTLFSGKTYPGSFVDSGSNALFFPNVTGLPLCSSGGPAPGFYCPSGVQQLSASNVGASGVTSSIPFEIGNAETLLKLSGGAIPALGGLSSGGFDWGLPFFFGRAVFIGFDGKSSSLGSGPYVAY